ncbi:TPA: hypothetical protein ACTWZ5_003429, partial [Legionella anisa]
TFFLVKFCEELSGFVRRLRNFAPSLNLSDKSTLLQIDICSLGEAKRNPGYGSVMFIQNPGYGFACTQATLLSSL